MYTREEASRLREEFWTTFGRYMRPVLSADGEKVNWVNYKTGKHGIQFRMDADTQCAAISIVINHTDVEEQQNLYDQFCQLRDILHETLQEEWHWQPTATNEYGKQVSMISMELKGVSIFKNEDWPQIISFFKSRIMALDEFWSMAKYSFN